LPNFKVIVGYIPIGKPNKIAQILGIPSEKQACPVIANRLIQTLDLGKISNDYFIGSVQLRETNFIIECDGKYEVQTQQSEQIIKISNLDAISNWVSNPQDGKLEIIIHPPEKKLKLFRRIDDQHSVFFAKKINILGKNKKTLPLTTEGGKVVKTPVKAEIIPKKLNIIVGRKRMF